MKKLLAVFACVLVLGVSQASASAPFCHDNTDKLIVQLKKVDLTTEQLKDVFVFQKQHREFVAQSHTDGRGLEVGLIDGVAEHLFPGLQFGDHGVEGLRTGSR